jgi:pimeloyl-ACP methyl ester carboxylesterase
MQLHVNGVVLHVAQRGAGSPAIVFLHYWGGSSRTWHRVIAPLERAFRTVAINHRGWGRSSAPERGYALADMADDAQAVIESLDLERYILVGHSMGGKVAQLIASRHPSGLIGLVLVAPAPPAPLALSETVRHGMARAYDSRDSIVATVEQVLAPEGLASKDLEMVIADSLAGTAAAKAAWPMRASQEDITAAVSGIDVPVIVVCGAHDRAEPPDILQRALSSCLPHAEWYVLPKVGHLLPLEAPTQLVDVIRAFIRRLVRNDSTERGVIDPAISPATRSGP